MGGNTQNLSFNNERETREMKKSEFLEELGTRLAQVGPASSQELIDFYDEAISDRMDAGMSEEDAVAQVGSIDEIIKTAKLDMPMPAVVKTRIKESHESAKNKGHGGVWIALVVIGFPVWFPLLTAVAAVLLSAYLVLWTFVLTLFAVELSLAAAAVAGFLGALTIVAGYIPIVSAVFLLGASLLLAGITFLLWKPLLTLAKSVIGMAKSFVRSVKKIICG